MPKKVLRKIFPELHKYKDHKHLRIFGPLLKRGDLWHLNRRSVAGAFSVGLFMAFIPLPTQMFFAAAAAIVLRVNLPVSVALVWITNPLTMGPVFYAAYKLGAVILGLDPIQIDFTLPMAELAHRFGGVLEPLLLGSLIFGTFFSILGNIAVRVGWRLIVVSKRAARRKLRD